MTIYNTVAEPYALDSQRSADSANTRSAYDSRLSQWPAGGYLGILESDAYLFHKSLSISKQNGDDSVASQVFGNQKELQHTNLEHSVNLLQERARIHKQHLRDIDHRHIEAQEKLFGVNINNFPDKAKRQSNLESQLLQLEQQKRDEELAFWKDTVDLRRELFDTAALYRVVKHRYSIFSDVEGKHGG